MPDKSDINCRVPSIQTGDTCKKSNLQITVEILILFFVVLEIHGNNYCVGRDTRDPGQYPEVKTVNIVNVILHLIKKREKTEKQFHKVATPPVSLEILSFIKRKFEIILFLYLSTTKIDSI